MGAATKYVAEVVVHVGHRGSECFPLLDVVKREISAVTKAEAEEELEVEYALGGILGVVSIKHWDEE